MMLPEPEPLTPESFAPYGEILRRQENGPAFQDLHTEPESEGWRVALLEVEPGPLKRMHRHPDSEECFAPLFGSPCIAVALPDDAEAFRFFRLDEPVCIRRQVWHEVISPDHARVFIAENAQISGEEHFLPAIEWSAD